jgi:hypothetical protein
MNPVRQQTAGATQPPTLSVDSQLMQDYLQSTGILVSTSASPSVAAFQNNDGDSEAVVIDVNGNLQHVCREPLSDSGWNMYGLGAGFRWIAPVDAATLWALGLTDVNFWQNNQGRWTQFQLPLPNGRAALELSVGIDGTVWALDDQGNVYAMASSPTQTPPRVGANAAPVAVQGCSGLLSLFCLDQNGALWTIGQSISAGDGEAGPRSVPRRGSRWRLWPPGRIRTAGSRSSPSTAATVCTPSMRLRQGCGAPGTCLPRLRRARRSSGSP